MKKEKLEETAYLLNEKFETFPLTKKDINSVLKKVEWVRIEPMEETTWGTLIPIYIENKRDYHYGIRINANISRGLRKHSLLHEIAHIIYNPFFNAIMESFDSQDEDYERLLDKEAERFFMENEIFVDKIYKFIEIKWLTRL